MSRSNGDVAVPRWQKRPQRSFPLSSAEHTRLVYFWLKLCPSAQKRSNQTGGQIFKIKHHVQTPFVCTVLCGILFCCESCELQLKCYCPHMWMHQWDRATQEEEDTEMEVRECTWEENKEQENNSCADCNLNCSCKEVFCCLASKKQKAMGWKPQHSFGFILRFVNIDNQRNLSYESYGIDTVDTCMQTQTNTPHCAHTLITM